MAKSEAPARGSQKWSTTLDVSELTRLFVEGDIRRNVVTVELDCCRDATAQIRIVRSTEPLKTSVLDVTLEGEWLTCTHKHKHAHTHFGRRLQCGVT